MRIPLKILTCLGWMTCSVLASSSSSSSDDLIFSSSKIREAYQTYQQQASVASPEWMEAGTHLLEWTKSFPLSSKPLYHQAEQFYIKKMSEEIDDLHRTLKNQQGEGIFTGLNKLSTWEESLRNLVSDEKVTGEDLEEEELKEIRRVLSLEEKVHMNRAIPPESDRCYEAISVKRTRLGNSDTMVDMGSSELDIPALISFNILPKHKTEETTDQSLEFKISKNPSIDVKHKVNSKYVVKIDAYKSLYQLTANSFYRGSDFRLQYNKDNGFLFLTDLTILGEGTYLKKVSQGPKADSKLLKSIVEDDSTRLPRKADLVFEFDLGGENALAFQMRFKEKKSKFFDLIKGSEVNEWIVNFVRSKDLNVVNQLMNEVLCQDDSSTTDDSK